MRYSSYKTRLFEDLIDRLNKLLPIEANDVKSSNVQSFGYNPVRKTLRITFKSGWEYRYSNVPRKVVGNFLRSNSKGKFVWKNIRDKYPHRRIKSKIDPRMYMKKGFDHGYEDAIESYRTLLKKRRT